MEVKITGGSELIELAKKFSQTPKVMGELSRNMAEEAVDLVKDGFDKESDPYGKKWLATARGGEILSDTGALKGSWKVKSATRAQFKVDASVRYASYHQDGAPKIRLPARMMVPDGKMPSGWMDAFEELAETMLEEHFG